ncbi:hypothetical protein AAC387_Pa04g0876 [Persea americana]
MERSSIREAWRIFEEEEAKCCRFKSQLLVRFFNGFLKKQQIEEAAPSCVSGQNIALCIKQQKMLALGEGLRELAESNLEFEIFMREGKREVGMILLLWGCNIRGEVSM